MTAALPASGRIALDTAPLIYFLQGAPGRSDVVAGLLRRAATGEVLPVVSAITEAELLVAPLRLEPPERDRACRVIDQLLVGPPAFDVRSVTRNVARAAAHYRATWGLRLADALVAASAVDAGCSVLLGNDTHFRRMAIDGLTYVHLDELVEPPG